MQMSWPSAPPPADVMVVRMPRLPQPRGRGGAWLDALVLGWLVALCPHPRVQAVTAQVRQRIVAQSATSLAWSRRELTRVRERVTALHAPFGQTPPSAPHDDAAAAAPIVSTAPAPNQPPSARPAKPHPGKTHARGRPRRRGVETSRHWDDTARVGGLHAPLEMGLARFGDGRGRADRGGQLSS
jgi:hypothetical protein